MKYIGTWWNSRDIELVNVDGAVYALNGWNGEKYIDCWQCSGEHLTEASGESYTLRPVYRYEVEGIDLDEIEENSAAWRNAVEIIDFDISSNF